MKTNFKDYSKMPVVVERKPNNWFSLHFKKLGLYIDKDYVVKLSKSNSRIIENDISTNESYNAEFAIKIYKYYQLLNNGNFPKTGRDAKTPITDVIRMIDLENSTNIWRYKDKRPQLLNMVDFIIEDKNCFWERLEKGDITLVDELRKSSKAETEGPKSLASKICKYFSEMFFNKDNYYINDYVVRHVLPFYMDYYGIEKKKNTKTYFDNLSYKELYKYIDELRKKVCGSLSKSEVDHIMWYCYRFESVSDE